MPPGGSGSPGMTSSSPVKKQATRGRRRSGSIAVPTAAARPMAAGVSRVPAGSTTLSRAMSSARRRTQSPGRGCTAKQTPSPSTSASSCITTASAPAGSAAPVKIRATVPGCSGWPGWPAGMRCDTGSRAPCPASSAARTA